MAFYAATLFLNLITQMISYNLNVTDTDREFNNPVGILIDKLFNESAANSFLLRDVFQKLVELENARNDPKKDDVSERLGKVESWIEKSALLWVIIGVVVATAGALATLAGVFVAVAFGIRQTKMTLLGLKREAERQKEVDLERGKESFTTSWKIGQTIPESHESSLAEEYEYSYTCDTSGRHSKLRKSGVSERSNLLLRTQAFRTGDQGRPFQLHQRSQSVRPKVSGKNTQATDMAEESSLSTVQNENEEVMDDNFRLRRLVDDLKFRLTEVLHEKESLKEDMELLRSVPQYPPSRPDQTSRDIQTDPFEPSSPSSGRRTRNIGTKAFFAA